MAQMSDVLFWAGVSGNSCRVHPLSMKQAQLLHPKPLRNPSKTASQHPDMNLCNPSHHLPISGSLHAHSI